MSRTRCLITILVLFAMGLPLSGCSDDPSQPGGGGGNTNGTDGADITINDADHVWKESSWAWENGTPMTMIMARDADHGLIILVPALAGTYDSGNPLVGGMEVFNHNGVNYSSDVGNAKIVLETFSATRASGSFTGTLFDEDGVVPDPIVVSGTFDVPRVYEEPDDVRN